MQHLHGAAAVKVFPPGEKIAQLSVISALELEPARIYLQQTCVRD